MEPILQHPVRPGAIALLEAAGLPTADLTDNHLQHFFHLGPPEAPIALVGCEIHGTHGLLRSLAVTPGNRGTGAGSALVDHVEAYARKQGVREMYLLTNTAEQFFARRGYVSVARAGVPVSIQSTPEYSRICPANSAVMAKYL